MKKIIEFFKDEDKRTILFLIISAAIISFKFFAH